jgi:hypothetical protein
MDNKPTHTVETFTCDDCKKGLPITKRCDPDLDVCNDCVEYYPNETGYCSNYCRVTGKCDESC